MIGSSSSGGGSPVERATSSSSGGTSRVNVLLEDTASHGGWKVFYSHVIDMVFYSGLTPLIVAIMAGCFVASAFATGVLETTLINVGAACVGALLKNGN